MSLKSKILNQCKIAIKSKNAYQLLLPSIKCATEDGILFIFHFYNMNLIQNFIKQESNVKSKGDPLLPPFDRNLHVCDLLDGANHHILINKFMQKPGHIVISSRKEDEVQGDKLNSTDFHALSKILTEFNGRGFAYYNSGKESGCSQFHKHLQFMPDIKGPVFNAMASNAKLPFLYHSTHLKDYKPRTIEEAYNELLEKASFDNKHPGYNLIISENTAVYVPRISAMTKNDILVNSVSLTGNLVVWGWHPPKNPLKILCEVTLPSCKKI